MRKVVYQVASSLDGFIADEQGGYDWIIEEEDIDFQELYGRFDVLLMGRKTWEVVSSSPENYFEGKRVIVVSATLQSSDAVEVWRDGITAKVEQLKREEGKDIWLYGGGELFRSLLDAGLVDEVELAFIPVLLSRGIPVIGKGERSPALHLQEMKRYPTGIIIANYRVGEIGA